MDFDKMFIRDKDLTDDPVVHEFPDGMELHVRRIGYRPYTGAMRTFTKANAFGLEHETMPSEKIDENIGENVGKHLLEGWKFREKGVLVTYTKEDAIRRCVEYSDFRDLVLKCAKNRQAYLKTNAAIITKNSPTATASASSGGGSSQ